jgi:hypothetical protein
LEGIILQLLLEQRNEIVSYEVMWASCWPGQKIPADYARQHKVTVHIDKIRNALADYGECIEPVPGVGYFFCDEKRKKVEEEETSRSEPLRVGVLPLESPEFSGQRPEVRERSYQKAFPGKQLPWYMPCPRNPFFGGRDTELHLLSAAAGSNAEKRVVQVLAGLPGLGKTSIAVEYAYRSRNDYSLVWWLDASNELSLLKGYEALARRFDTRYDQHGLSAIDYLSAILSGFSDWLLILDGATIAEHVLFNLPKTGIGHILITSVDRNWRGAAEVIDIPPLEPAAAIAFLNRRLRILSPDPGLDWVPELVTELSSIPGALEIASMYLEDTGCKIKDYLSKIRAMRKKSFLIAGYEQSAELAVLKAWEPAFQTAHCVSLGAWVILRACEWLDDCPVPLDLREEIERGSLRYWRSLPSRIILFLGVLSSRRWLTPPKPPLPRLMGSKDLFTFNEALLTLQRFSLVKVDETTFTVSPLIKVMVRIRQTKGQQKRNCRYILSSIRYSALGAIYRNDRGSAALWVRHLRSVIAHSSALGIPAEDESVQQTQQALNEVEKSLARAVFGPVKLEPTKPSRPSFRELLIVLKENAGTVWSDYWPLICIMISWGVGVLSLLGGISLFLYAYFHGVARTHLSAFVTCFRICEITLGLSVCAMPILLGIKLWKKKNGPQPSNEQYSPNRGSITRS